MDVVADQWGVEQNAEPLASNQEQDVEENVQDVPGKINSVMDMKKKIRKASILSDELGKFV